MKHVRFINYYVHSACVERENSRPITSWHITLPCPQNTANYKAPRAAIRFCYHYSEANRNLPSVMQKPITHQCTCKWWHKQHRTCKRWHKQPRTCKRWLKWTNQAVTCVTNQAPPRVAHPPQTSINRSLPKTLRRTKIQEDGDSRTKIQKWKSSAGIKPWSLQELQELQPQNRRTFEAESSKPFA